MSPELKCAQNAAKKAGAAILSQIGTVKVEEKDSSYNLVTTADTMAQQIITDSIRATFPDDAIYGEEGNAGRPSLDVPRLWVIDPIDGTTNFAHCIPHYATSIAFAQKGTVECGCVLDIPKNELFSAQRATGAWCNGSPIRVSATNQLTQAVIATGFYYERGPIMLKTLDTMRQLYLANIQGIRRMGSAALDLCYVACGRYDGYFEYRLSPWDFAAGMLIVEEAGGSFRDSDGTAQGLHSAGVLASNTALTEPFFKTVALSASHKF